MISHGRLSTLDREFIYCMRQSRSVIKRTFSQWLEEVFWIPSGKHANEPFSFDTQPVTRLWADCIDSDLWTEYVHTGVSQYGKSLMGYIAPMLYYLHEMREHVVMGVPIADMASNKWERDILPVLNAAPEMRSLVPISGAGSGGGKVRDMVTMGNGQFLKIMAAGGDDVNKASYTSRIVAITEAARFSEGAESSVEAEPFAQLQARQRSYPESERRTFIEGTLTTRDELPWSLREGSTKSRILTPCPHCEAWILPGRNDLMGWQEARSDKEALDKAFFVCPECGEAITDEQRRDSIRACQLVHDGQSIDRRGRVIGDPPNTLRLWFHVQGWHNMLLRAGDLAVDEWRAAQIPDYDPRHDKAQRKLAQFVWSMPYVPPHTAIREIDPLTLSKRQLPYKRGIVPPDTLFLSGGVDLGGRIGWYVVLANRPDGRRHVVDYDKFDIDNEALVQDAAITAALRLLRDRFKAGYTIANPSPNVQPIMLLSDCWVDAGFYPDPVLAFARETNAGNPNGRTWWITPSIGRGETQLDRTNYSAPKRTGNEVREVDSGGLWHLSYVPSRLSWEFTLDGDAWKLAAQAGMTLNDIDGPGSLTLFEAPADEHKRAVAHFTSEQLETIWHPTRGETKVWKKKGENHLLDCLAYATAAGDRRRQLLAKK